MTDVFLLGAGFSKAVCKAMPTMKELYGFLEPLAGNIDGFSKEVYQFASGNVETLLSYYAIPSPHDDGSELLHKRRVTALLENEIGRLLRNCEEEGATDGLNPNAERLLVKWHEDQSHILTTNYDTLVERIASRKMFLMSDGKADGLFYTDLYPIPVTNALARDGGGVLSSDYPNTFTLYKLHGSTTWYKSMSESSFDPIYGVTYNSADNARYRKFVADKRRFIVPPVYDHSSLLNHESIRSLWWQAREYSLRQADNVYVIGYSLPETDAAMQTLLWEGSRTETYQRPERKTLYVVDVSKEIGRRYTEKLGEHYDVKDCYAGYDGAFDVFVNEYVENARGPSGFKQKSVSEGTCPCTGISSV